MTREQLIRQIRNKGSFLCVGLDPDPRKLPSHTSRDTEAIVPFCQAIIETTMPYCVAYKLNIAFFESLGHRGWDILYRVRELLPAGCLLIADAKRADIGNTSRMYAKAFFEELRFDAITVAPYMGEDSIAPFLDYEGKWTIVLALTSNQGARDFQMRRLDNGKPLYVHVLETVSKWGNAHRLMFVAGGTQAEYLKQVRETVPDHFLLVPGIGAQGGDLNTVTDQCMTDDVGLLINSSREILYASSGKDFAEAAAEKAIAHQAAMSALLDRTIRH